jgi:hypothetical protein
MSVVAVPMRPIGSRAKLAGVPNRLRKKSVDGGSAAIHWVRHVRNPLICRDRISSIEHVSCLFFPNRDFSRSLLIEVVGAEVPCPHR